MGNQIKENNSNVKISFKKRIELINVTKDVLETTIYEQQNFVETTTPLISDEIDRRRLEKRIVDLILTAK